MNSRRALSLLAAAGLLAAGPARAQIYGPDDRKDVFEAAGTPYAALAHSTFALFKAKDVMSYGAGGVRLRTQAHGEQRRLVAGERFYDQPAGGFCSGALVGPDLALTAAHCVHTQAECDAARIVFGFSLYVPGAAPQVVRESDVYACGHVVASRLDDGVGDWALLRLDRRVEDATPLAVDVSGAIGKGDAVVAIGHPAGLPTKIVGGAEVRDVQWAKGYFTAPLDTFPGSSGSPVFSATTRKIVGVMCAGNPLYEYRALTQIDVTPNSSSAGETRYIPYVLPQDGGTGTFVTLAGEFSAALRTATATGAPRRAVLRPLAENASYLQLLRAYP